MNAGRFIDHELNDQAQVVLDHARQLANWVAEHAPQRDDTPEAISLDDQLRLMRLRQEARQIYTAAGVPVAAALFGPSQAGKSLFVGQVLKTKEDSGDAMGWEPDPKAEKVSFQDDLNPTRGAGSHEATALVTRFTTSERAPVGTSSEFPIAIRPMRRMELICVMAQGFASECKRAKEELHEHTLDGIIGPIAKTFPGGPEEASWRSDILDAFSYMKSSVLLRSNPFLADIYELNRILAQYPLNREGYIKLVERLFWPGHAPLTEEFSTVLSFLDSIVSEDGPLAELRENVIVTEYRAVRFLLDCQRNPHQEYPNLGTVDWGEFRLLRDDAGVVRLARSTEGQAVALEVIQAAMREMVAPVITPYLSGGWEEVLDQMDLLDFPGLRAGKAGGVTVEKLQDAKERADLVVRGKVNFLFEQYAQTLQIQSVLTFLPNSNLEVGAQLSELLNAWGEIRFGPNWSVAVPDRMSPLIIGLTMHDKSLHDHPRAEAFDSWIHALLQCMSHEMTNYRGQQRHFDDFHLIRYPGKADLPEIEWQGKERFAHARQAYLESTLVAKHVTDAEARHACAMNDGDGGLSLIAPKLVEGTSNDERHADLQRRLRECIDELQQLGARWHVSTDKVKLRQARVDLAHKLLHWIGDSHDGATRQRRLRVLQHCLAMPVSLAHPIADLADDNTETANSIPKKVATELLAVWNSWVSWASKCWADYVQANRASRRFKDWFAPQDFSNDDFLQLTSWLRDFLLTDAQQRPLEQRLLGVMALQGSNPVALREARRRLVGVAMNDAILNPGLHPLGQVEVAPDDEHPEITEVWERWNQRLPDALGDGCDGGAIAPPGNEELGDIINTWDDLAPDDEEE